MISSLAIIFLTLFQGISEHIMLMLKKVIVQVRPLFKDYIYTIPHGFAKGLIRKGGLGFIPSLRSLNAEEEFLTSLDLTSKTVFDIGAFEGIFTLFFARAVGDTGRVITFEPNPINYQRVLEHLELNHFSHVDVKMIALGNTTGELELSFRKSEAGSGSIHPEIRAEMEREVEIQTVSVPLDTLDNQIRVNHLTTPDLVKIDVEGLEPNILEGMQDLAEKGRPSLYIELHGTYLPKTHLEYNQSICQLLRRYRYSVFYVEKQQSINLLKGELPAFGHLYCTAID